MELDKDLPFETLLKLEEKLGSKTFREVHSSTKNEVKTLLPRRTHYDSDQPFEQSSKKPHKKSHVELPKAQRVAPSIDPRFNPRAGTFKADHFRRNFQFAFELKEKELEHLKKSTPTNTDVEEQKKAKYLIQRMENQKRDQQKKDKAKVKPIINKDGSKYFPGKKEILAKDLVSKYEELKSSGKLQSHLEKRRKKQAGMERKRMGIEK